MPHIIRVVLFLSLSFNVHFLIAQSINLENITICRDQWGVPHIFSKTDKEAVYGLAWAHCEDNFEEIQEPLMISRGLLGEVKGIEGTIMDAVSFLFKTEEIAKEKYDKAFSPAFKDMLASYILAVNRYAELHPEEVRHPDLFPATVMDIVKGYILSMAFISNIQFDLGRLLENKMEPLIRKGALPAGSNAFAFSPSKTKDGKTYLVSNSHQPLRGYMAWYEVHICTEEGWNVSGATFAGGTTPFVGTNPNLSWTHCVNYNDGDDVYQLKMHPKEKNSYHFDGKWLKLEERIFKGKVKLGPFKLKIKKKFYWSVHGPVVRNKTGYYALRFPAIMVAGAAEQWYKMNKARNLEEFKEALNMQQHASLTTTYADKSGNIFFLDNGLFPYRDSAYNWAGILPGDTSACLWPEKFRPLDSLLWVQNPASGYLYHMNGSGFYCTADADRPKSSAFPKTMGYQQYEVARNFRFRKLIKDYDQLDLMDVKKIKYDQHMEFPLHTRTLQNLDILRNLSEKDHPRLKDIIPLTRKWNGSTDPENMQAAIFSLAIQFILDYMQEKGIQDVSGSLDPEVYVRALTFSKKHLLKYFGRLEIPLGDLQKHVRGNKMLPIGGVPEAISSLYTTPYKKKYLQSLVGDSFIQFSIFGSEGLEKIESVNCYGSSNRPESPHYNDQMEMYLNKQTKTMTLDKASIMQNATNRYHPE